MQVKVQVIVSQNPSYGTGSVVSEQTVNVQPPTPPYDHPLYGKQTETEDWGAIQLAIGDVADSVVSEALTQLDKVAASDRTMQAEKIAAKASV